MRVKIDRGSYKEYKESREKNGKADIGICVCIAPLVSSSVSGFQYTKNACGEKHCDRDNYPKNMECLLVPEVLKKTLEAS